MFKGAKFGISQDWRDLNYPKDPTFYKKRIIRIFPDLNTILARKTSDRWKNQTSPADLKKV
jgi:hypothetical protein